MRKLYLQFKDGNGRRKTLIVEHCHQNLTPATVYHAMEEIIALRLFERNGTQLYTEIIGAKYVEKRVTVLFDVDKQVGKTDDDGFNHPQEKKIEFVDGMSRQSVPRRFSQISNFFQKEKRGPMYKHLKFFKMLRKKRKFKLFFNFRFFVKYFHFIT